MNKQIEEMAKATMKHCEIDNQCGSCHWSTCNECLSEVLYNAGFHKTEWISVEERLPERSTRVLAYSKKYNKVDVYYYGDVDEWWDNDGWASAKYYEITHWMPLPEAPKGDEEK